MRCSSTTPSPKAPGSGAGSTSPAGPTPAPRGRARMRLGLLTAPFPETPLTTSSIGRLPTASRASRSPAGHAPPARPDATPGPATSTSRTCPRARRAIVDEIAQGPRDLRPRLLPEPAPSRSRPPSGHRPPQARHHGRRDDERPPRQHVHGRRRLEGPGRELGGSPPRLAGHRRLRGGPRPQDHHRELPDAVQRRRVARRPQPRDDAPHLAPHPRGMGRHGRAQLRPVAPDPPDDRHPAVHPRVRAAHPPRAGQGPVDRPRGAVRARRLLDGIGWQIPRLPGLGDVDWAPSSLPSGAPATTAT